MRRPFKPLPESAPPGPYLLAAAFCRNTIPEPTGTVTLEEIVSHWTPEAPVTNPDAVIDVEMGVCFASAGADGEKLLTVEEMTSGKPLLVWQGRIRFRRDRGLTICAPAFPLPAFRPWRYLFRVSLEGKALALVPFAVQPESAP